MDTKSQSEISPEYLQQNQSTGQRRANQSGTIDEIPGLIEEEPRKIFAFCPLYFQCDQTGIILQANAPSDRGVPSIWIGQNLMTLLPRQLAVQVKPLLEEVCSQSRMIQQSYQLEGNTSYQWIKINLLPIAPQYVGVFVEDISDQKQMELTHELLQQAIVSSDNETLWSNWAMQVATALNCSEVRITQRVGERLEPLAWIVEGIEEPKIAYCYAHTPCHITLSQGRYYCSESLQTKFPHDPSLSRSHAQGYIGIGLKSSTGENLGTICCLSQSPIVEVEFVESLLQMIGQKIVVELERQQIIQEFEHLNHELEQRVAEQLQILQRSEQDLRTIINSAFDGLYLHEFDGTFIEVNNRALEMHGLSRDEFLKLSIPDLSVEPPERLAEVQLLLSQTVCGETLRFEWQCRNYQDPDHPVPSEVILQKATLSDREVIVATLRDIRERKQRELAMETIIEGTAMKSGQAFYQTCVESLAHIFQASCTFLLSVKDGQVRDPLAQWLASNCELPVMTKLCEMTLGESWGLLISSQLSSYFPEYSQKVKTLGESYLGVIIEDRNRQAIGIVGLIHAQPLSSSPETMQYIVRLIAKHIAGEMERQASEAQIRTSQKQLFSFVDYSPASISIKDREGRYLLCNRVLAEQLDHPPKKVIGKTDHDIFEADVAEKIWNQDQVVLRKGEVQTQETEIRHPNGQSKTYLTIKFPLIDDAEEIYAVGAIKTDISTQKQVEKTLQNLNTELEQRVVARTEELQKALERADCANQAKSEFLASVSHELRTPLNGILGYAQILHRSKHLTERDLKGITIIDQCSRHLLNLINDILDLSKFDAQKLSLNPSVTHLPNLLHEIVDTCQIRINSEKVIFESSWSESLPEYVLVDEKRLRQVLLNLISNAIKFTDAGFVRFRISCLESSGSSFLPPQEMSTCTLQFEVEDSGIGIAQHHLKQLFNSFEQVGDRAHHSEGTGLGLAISQRIVKLMESEIHVQSELNVGSRFYFSLVLPISPAPCLSVHRIDQSASTILGYQGSRRKLLIIDDRWENRAVFLNLLTPLGFELEMAENGQLGLDKLQGYIPDLILLDLVMPVMNGNEFLMEIRQNPKFRGIKVIVATASASQEEIADSISVGADDYLAKPIAVETLMMLLQKHLQISWIYESNTKQQSLHSLHPQVLEIAPPAPEIVEKLRTLAQSGRLKKLSTTIKVLSEKKVIETALAKHLEDLIQRFDCDAIDALLDAFTHE